MGWIRALILVCVSIGVVAAQKSSVPTLQLGIPLERTLSAGQSHTYQVVAEENSLSTNNTGPFRSRLAQRARRGPIV